LERKNLTEFRLYYNFENEIRVIDIKPTMRNHVERISVNIKYEVNCSSISPDA